MNKTKLVRQIILVALTITGCGAPAATSEVAPTSGPDLALTITAQALLLEGLTQTALAPTSTSEPTFTPAPVFTQTPSKVIVTVSANTNCRSGPGLDFAIEGALTIGQEAEVVGKSSATGYWIIDNPIGPGTCWLWGEHATIKGDTTGLQEVAAPPTVTPLAALAPVIDGMDVRFDTSSGGMIAVISVYYHDNEGDANYLDLQVIHTSIEVTAKIKSVSFAPNANQKRGGVVTGTWSCGSKEYQMTVAAVIRDLAGNVSNSRAVTFNCN